MGLPKATLSFGPETMLARVLRLLGEAVGPLVVVAAPDQELPPLPRNVILVRDRREGNGPLEGLRAGLEALSSVAPAAYVTACDVPLLMGTFVARMCALLADYEIAVPQEDRFFHPLAAVYRTSLVKRIDELLAADCRRPLHLIEASRTHAEPVEALRPFDPQLRTLQNLNQPADYLAALSAAGFQVDPQIAARLPR